MIIEIPKRTSLKKISSILKTTKTNSTKKNIDSFFANCQILKTDEVFKKKARNSWQS
jgi:hypothetical protein